ncbi:MAG TPA: flagellar hook capping FlgD N-terminal domain-containing protein [Phycisphaerae bacterium]|nr:flagellar hook capping FlgD N-terminal domain-containing protein [Phycisphaerae bacterium]HRW51559.1 flagellar hook capping FlgD N-terminal domain-containing protein [Phycisphaerae bacterium]
MDAASITAQTNAAIAGQKATTRGFDDISSEDFFGLMIEELRSQDPLDPKDNQQLLQQMSNIRQMEQSQTLTKTLQSLSNEQRFGTTASLIGNYVLGTVTDSSGASTDIDGLVIGVTFEGNGNAVLNLHDGKRLPAASVREVTLVENLPPEILDQLEAELASISSGDSTATTDTTAGADTTTTDGVDETTGDSGTGDTTDTNSAAARSAAPDRDAAAKLLNRIRAQRAAVRPNALEKAISDGANIVGELLDSIFSPGIGVRTGA